MIISVLNQNGGAGKTTLAVHLAAWLAEKGCNVAVFDCDPQASAKRWLAKAAPGLAVFTPLEPTDVVKLHAQYSAHLDVIIADSKPGLDATALQLARLSDLIVMPIKPSGINIDGSVQAVVTLDKMGIFKKRGDNVACAVLNFAEPNSAGTKRTRLKMDMLGVRSAKNMLGDRKIFVAAYEQGAVAWKMRDVSPGYSQAARLAGDELNKLFMEIVPNGLYDQRTETGGAVSDNAASGERGIGIAEGEATAAA